MQTSCWNFLQSCKGSWETNESLLQDFVFPTFKNRIAVYLFAFDHWSVILDLVKWFCVGDLGQQSADLRSACGNCWRAPSQRWNDGVSVAEKMLQGHAESCLTVQRISNLSSTISLLLTKGQHTHSFLLGLNLPLNSQRLRLDPPSVTDYCYHVLFFFFCRCCYQMHRRALRG